jgi:LytS/YehU family sensor histidine kinase
MCGAGIINLFIIGLSIAKKVLMFDTVFFWEITQYVISFGLIVLCVLQIIKDKKNTKVLVPYICINIALIIDMIGAFESMYYTGMGYKVAYVIMLVAFLFIGVKQVVIDHHASIKNKKLKEELEKSRIAIMLSQIQPHFLYNSLTSVMDLCDSNPKQAKGAIADFADYLRGNLSSLKTEKPISFRTELEHIEKYLRLEKLRFQDELEIVYDIQIQDFMLPTLSVQPLVENAVKHGVGQKSGGGTVTIRTYETEDDYVICITDDGVGFADGEYAENEGTHIGIENTKKRLQMMVNARLEIESKKGEGTKACIFIPKRRE